jgi:23S rRNA pseudouridine955/2504/2580 synthase
VTQAITKVRVISITEDQSGQRLDNFLMARLKGVPRGHVYRLLRSGQVRVNSGRKKAHYRLQAGDDVRIPPVTTKTTQQVTVPDSLQQSLEASIVLEDEHVIVLNKPSGVPVHAGSGYRYGVIDSLRASRPNATLELVHRLDRETSGCLLLAKSRKSLAQCHAAFRNEHAIDKQYLALVDGHWPGSTTVDARLDKVVRSGERMMQVSDAGQRAVSHFECQQAFGQPMTCSLMRIVIETGRTHQIRVHAAHHDHAIAGDNKYGDKGFNAACKSIGLNRLFLHAERLELELPELGTISASAPLPAELQTVINALT